MALHGTYLAHVSEGGDYMVEAAVFAVSLDAAEEEGDEPVVARQYEAQILDRVLARAAEVHGL